MVNHWLTLGGAVSQQDFKFQSIRNTAEQAVGAGVKMPLAMPTFLSESMALLTTHFLLMHSGRQQMAGTGSLTHRRPGLSSRLLLGLGPAWPIGTFGE